MVVVVVVAALFVAATAAAAERATVVSKEAVDKGPAVGSDATAATAAAAAAADAAGLDKADCNWWGCAANSKELALSRGLANERLSPNVWDNVCAKGFRPVPLPEVRSDGLTLVDRLLLLGLAAE